MRGFVPLDPQSNVSTTHYAVVYSHRKKRKRFSAGCVQIFDDKQQAIENSHVKQKKYAAIVLGPSKSSEGQAIYYWVKWL